MTGFLETALDSNKAKIIKKLNAPATQSGHVRLFPNPSKDNSHQFRIDAGQKVNGKQNHSSSRSIPSPASSGLKEWVSKQGSKGTHADLAKAVFDSNAKDQEVELNRVKLSMLKQGKDNLASGKAAK